MKKIIFCLIVCLNVLAAVAQDKPAYLIFTAEGQQVIYSKMIDGIKGSDITFFGEFHDNPIAHWLELEVTKDLFTI